MFKILGNIIKAGWKFIMGIVLIVIGIAGLVLPIIPGIALIIIGGAVISPRFREDVKRFGQYLKEKWINFKKEHPL